MIKLSFFFYFKEGFSISSKVKYNNKNNLKKGKISKVKYLSNLRGVVFQIDILVCLDCGTSKLCVLMTMVQ